jgi:hypothetical protein
MDVTWHPDSYRGQLKICIPLFILQNPRLSVTHKNINPINDSKTHKIQTLFIMELIFTTHKKKIKSTNLRFLFQNNIRHEPKASRQHGLDIYPLFGCWSKDTATA